MRKKAKDAKKPDTKDVGDAQNTGNANDDLDINIALEDNDFDIDVDYAEADIDELLKSMEKAKEFIGIADKVKKLKDHEMAKLRDMAKSNRRRFQ